MRRTVEVRYSGNESDHDDSAADTDADTGNAAPAAASSSSSSSSLLAFVVRRYDQPRITKSKNVTEYSHINRMPD